MSKLISGLALSTTVTLSLLAGTAGPAAAVASAERSAPTLTDFGYRADVYAVKLVTDNVEAFNVKDAHAQLRCTRAIGQSAEKSSVLSVPDNPLVNIAASTSRTDTYQDGSTNGVVGVNTVGDIRIGGEVAGVRTPTLVIEGLTTSANAFHTPQGFGHEESFDFARIRLELLEGTPLQGTPLEALLAPLDQVTDTVFEGTNQAANEIFKVLQSATAPIQIPGLGSIALGKVRGSANAKRATSEAMALEIVVDAGGSRQLVEIGSANARIGAPAPAGVFRAGGSALDLQALQSSLRFGNVQHKSIPCEGTLGKTMTYHVPSAGVLGGLVARVTGVTYSHRGKQNARKDLAKGFSAVSIASTSVPAVGLEVSDIVSRVTMRGKENRPVKSKVTSSIGAITFRGQPVAVPAPGQTVELPGGAGLLQRQVVKDSRYGAASIGLRVQLFAEAVVLDLGLADGHIYPR
ncbi:choice-of-anchor P family protein [Nocardioides currus]|uniref:Uncharacterized protein n=1 Tax=Nocardioides currus TaxID=2133958 RepID=A0A2R7YV97_9ACTN|nr:choice-of-anchor P family protein [Nocardioides currus]PUA80295.1 hypothetical protein C7S10_14260 [Nocardioides currus]